MKMINPTAQIPKHGQAARWEALVARGRDAVVSAFYYGVRTTRVFCRSTCRSRLPKRENVIFFNSVDEALVAGFRACKRCQPDKQPFQDDVAARITRACRMLEHEQAPPLETLARSAGMSRFHFHRLFKKQVGVTPKQ
jgi:AraC family transcriptional regulator of adaptative response/methylated-DNA-[protein]-cysteine methyltransferase